MQRRIEYTKYRHIQLAFKQDCENLLTQYAELNSLSYTDFAKLWTKMSFSLIYSGKSSYDEMRHFTESCFFEAKKFLIFPKNLNIRVGALYLLFGLYYKQPLRDFVKIRFIQSEFAVLMDLINEMKSKKNLQALYIYAKMKTDDIFDLVYHQTTLAPDLKHFVDHFIMKDDIFQKTNTQTIKDMISDVIAGDDLTKINDEYQTALRDYKESTGQHFQTYECNVLQDIKKIYERYQSGAEPEKVEVKSEEDIGEKRRRLKKRAAASSSKSMK